MPTYVYEVVSENGEPGERFEYVQPMSDEPLSKHPETGQPVRRVFVPFHVAGKYAPLKTDRNLSDDKKLERLGFTKFVKSADGQYDRAFGKEGPKQLKKPKS